MKGPTGEVVAYSPTMRQMPRCCECKQLVKWDKRLGWVHRKTGTYNCPAGGG